jgi:hypothetical protein
MKRGKRTTVSLQQFGGRRPIGAFFFSAALLLLAPIHAEVRLLAYGAIAPDAKDQLGDTIGGLGSAAAYDPKTGDVFLMPDRGAGDGTLDYRPRCYRVNITRDQKTLLARVVETILFRDARGRAFTGLTADPGPTPTRSGRRCLDPEAIAVAPDGSLYVSDEYQPALLHFDRSGHLLRTIPLPAWYRPGNETGTPDYTSGAKIRSGRTENQGCEAMGILPDGRRAVLILQSALAQDGGRGAGTSRVLILDLRTGQPLAEYPYAFSRPPGLAFSELSVNDLAVLDDHTLLVLERDGRGRNGALHFPIARYKSVWLVDFSHATNLLALPGRPYASSPADPVFKRLARHAGLAFVRKTRLFNLPDLLGQLDLHRKFLDAKWEGLTRLPSDDPRVFRLLLTADNDFVNPSLTFHGVTHHFPRAEESLPTQLFEIRATDPRR